MANSRRIIPKINPSDPVNVHNFMQHLAKEHGFLESLFQTIREAVIVTDDTLQIQYYNAAAKEILGLPEQIKYDTVLKLLPGIRWETLLSGKSAGILRQELELNYPEHRLVQFYAMPMDSKRKQYALILNDITATMKRAADSAADERIKMVSLLAAGVAHEIGNPLNSLYLHLQFLQQLLAGPEAADSLQEALEELKESREEVERLDNIIRQFLHAVRPGKMQMNPLDLKQLVLESLNFMRHELNARDIKLEFFWGENIPLINGDDGQLKQVLYNLVKNALQSMEQSGHLSIRCFADSDFVILSVTDSGKGMCQEELSKIFTPYYTTKGTGTGLGLMIVDRIVRAHGAGLSVDSAPGKGTTFKLSFPRIDRRIKVLPPPEENRVSSEEHP